MRFFRIPSFTGIEAHRDDADRGSLRLVEGCLPHGPGGLRSGPVWKKIGDVSKYSTNDSNHVTAADDGQGNSALFVSRNCEIHDLAVISSENTNIESFGESYDVAIPEVSLYNAGPANLTPIGNRIYAVGDGSYEAMFVGKGPENIVLKSGVAPDEDLYEQEWSRFPKCQYFVQGPKKTIFASGNPDRPLTVYISEPAGITAPFRDTPYSSEDTTYNVGQLSTVEILGSNASKITALSTRGDQVVVHTDKGCHLLYAPAPDQASTGYRVEQAPATNFSAAVNSKVVSRASGALTYWVGHDGQVYKDEAASRGSEDLRSRADEDQANWKSKGVWEDELPTDLTDSFAAYSPQSGDYLFFVKDDSYYQKPKTPTGFELVKEPALSWTCKSQWCEAINDFKSCCGPVLRESDFDNGGYLNAESCLENSDCTSVCCGALGGVMDCCDCAGFGNNWFLNEDCECYFHPARCPGVGGFASEAQCQENLKNLPESDACHRYALEVNSCNCIKVTADLPDGKTYAFFDTEAECIARVSEDGYCSDTYNTDPQIPCLCEKAPEGTTGEFSDYYTCRKSLHGNPDCRPHQESGCECIESDSWGYFHTKASCLDYVDTLSECAELYELQGCECVSSDSGTFTLEDCLSSRPPECFGKYQGPCCESGFTTGYDTYEECKSSGDYQPVGYNYCSTLGGWAQSNNCEDDNLPDYRYSCNLADGSCSSCPELVWEIANCQCTTILSDLALGNTYETEAACIESIASEPECVLYQLDTNTCSCSSIVSQMDPDGVSTFADLSSCEAARDGHSQCQKYSIQDCQCVEDSSGSFTGLTNCQTALSSNSECSPHWLVDCDCTTTDPADGTPSFPDLTACSDASLDSVECNCDSTDRRYNTFEDLGDTFCMDAGSGSGAFTECECMELGYTII